MGEIRYHILHRVNQIRSKYGKNELHIHEVNSDAAQKHAQYILEEMIKQGNQRFQEIGHHNPYCYGEYNAENMGEFSFPEEMSSSLERMIDCMLLYMMRDGREHLTNIIGDFNHLGAEVAVSNEPKLIVLVQRFS